MSKISHTSDSLVLTFNRLDDQARENVAGAVKQALAGIGSDAAAVAAFWHENHRQEHFVAHPKVGHPAPPKPADHAPTETDLATTCPTCQAHFALRGEAVDLSPAPKRSSSSRQKADAPDAAAA